MLLRNVTLYFGYITVGEQPSKDETKYMKQGVKPKKKMRALAPPVSSPSKSTSNIRQLNSNLSETSRPFTGLIIERQTTFLCFCGLLIRQHKCSLLIWRDKFASQSLKERKVSLWRYYLFAVALRPNAGHGLLIFDVSRSHTTTYHSR